MEGTGTFPPNSGGGESQRLSRLLVPLPHVLSECRMKVSSEGKYFNPVSRHPNAATDGRAWPFISNEVRPAGTAIRCTIHSGAFEPAFRT